MNDNEAAVIKRSIDHLYVVRLALEATGQVEIGRSVTSVREDLQALLDAEHSFKTVSNDVTCPDCLYKWEYTGELNSATCPNCQQKVLVGQEVEDDE